MTMHYKKYIFAFGFCSAIPIYQFIGVYVALPTCFFLEPSEHHYHRWHRKIFAKSSGRFRNRSPPRNRRPSFVPTIIPNKSKAGDENATPFPYKSKARRIFFGSKNTTTGQPARINSRFPPVASSGIPLEP